VYQIAAGGNSGSGGKYSTFCLVYSLVALPLNEVVKKPENEGLALATGTCRDEAIFARPAMWRKSSLNRARGNLPSFGGDIPAPRKTRNRTAQLS